MFPIPITFSTSAYTAVTGTTAQFATTMVKGVQYVLRADTDLWWRADTSNPTAAANTAQNHFLAKGQTAFIAGTGFKVAVIRATADGNASLSVMEPGA